MKAGLPPLASGRVMADLWTLLVAFAVGVLVARLSSLSLACLAAAAMLAPYQESVWLLLIRVDGLALALWLLAAVLVMPDRLERSESTLSTPRATLAAGLLVAAVLTRPTSALVGAPLVACWWFVDRRSALRITLATGSLGLLALAVLQAMTRGAYLFQLGVWLTHGTVPGQIARLLLWCAGRCAPLLALAAVGVVAWTRLGGKPWRDGSVVLLVGGALMIPLTAKGGASTNYHLPLLAALVVFSFRGWAAVMKLADRSPGVRSLAGWAPVVATLALLAIQHVRLPSSVDAVTAARFYGALSRAKAETGAPLLALTPDYAYVLLGQSDEVLGASLLYLLRARAPGVERVFERLSSATYGAIVIQPQYWPDDPDWRTALGRGYRLAGRCWLGYYYGDGLPYYVMVRRDVSIQLEPEAGTRCEGPDTATGPRKR